MMNRVHDSDAEEAFARSFLQFIGKFIVQFQEHEKANKWQASCNAGGTH